MSAAEDDVVDQILKSGEANPEVARKQARDGARRSLEVARNVAATFSTPAGQSVLAWLRQQTVEQPAFLPGIGDRQHTGLDAAHQGFLREGQNSIYREFVRQIALAQNPPDALVRLAEGGDL